MESTAPDDISQNSTDDEMLTQKMVKEEPMDCSSTGFESVADSEDRIEVDKEKNVNVNVDSSLQLNSLIENISTPISLKEPPNKKQKMTIEEGDYKLFNKSNKKTLIIFHFDDRTKCYSYYYHKQKNKYICSPCDKIRGASCTAIFANGENNGPLILNSFEHACSPLVYADQIKKFNITTVAVYKPNYEVFTQNINGTVTKTILVYIKGKKAYEFKKPKGKNNFYCMPCRSKENHISAKLLYDEDDEDYLEINQKEHICSPRSLNKIYIRVAPERLPPLKERTIDSLEWLKPGEFEDDYKWFMGFLNIGHPNPVNLEYKKIPYTFYIITRSPKDDPPERKLDGIVYVGKSGRTGDAISERLYEHITNGVLKPYHDAGIELLLFPVITDTKSKCEELEAVTIELCKHSIHLQLENDVNGDFHLEKMKIIAEKPNHSDHQKMVNGVRKLLYEAVSPSEGYSSFISESRKRGGKKE